MDSLSSNLGGILFTGVGLALALLGFKMVRFHVHTLGVIALAAAGCAGGVLLGWPWAAAALAVAGAVGGYKLGPHLYPVYVAIVGAAGGALLGLAVVFVTAPSNPRLVLIASAIAFGLIALLHARALTIGWTSLIGAAIATLGLQTIFHGPIPTVARFDGLSTGLYSLTFFVTGLVVQCVTNPEEKPEPVMAAKVKPVPRRPAPATQAP